MSRLLISRGIVPTRYLRPTVAFIARTQQSDGALPWFDGGVLDPWDHVEAAMGLSIGGRFDEAEAAYGWLRRHQRDDGSWLAAYRDGRVEDDTRAETNFVAYVATGVWHHYLVSGREAFLTECWDMVRDAIGFVLDLQTEHGEIHWALDTRTGVNRDALVTGCSSIYKSLECTINIAHILGEDTEALSIARARLGHALRHRPERFDRTWDSKARYSMDWFYPVLTGVIEGAEARKRLDARWEQFVEPGLGCRCVADEPWVTIAESCELTLALLASNQPQRACEVFSWLHDYRHEDGSYWTGYAMRDDVLWPDERPTWTAGAVLLAADALSGATAASRLFTHVELPEPSQQAERLHHGQLLEQT